MEIALLILRIGAGLLFAGHGAQKLFGWFGGHGIEGTAGFFEGIGLRPGKLHARAAGFNEFAGGLLLAAGLLTPLAAVLIVATMTAAVLTVHIKNGPWNTDNGYELNILYSLIAVAVAGIGAGELSLDHALGLDVAGIGWALGGAAIGLLGGATAVVAGRRVGEGSDAGPHPATG
jgi:putative oxidoreductase